METSAISYRVADFLKHHPPFNAIEESDLVALAARGRVRFYEPNEFILWQGEPHKAHVFVIQQGTVSLWDERGGQAELRDVRGAGDLLGAERFNGERSCPYSARSTSDVVVYGFPEDDFAALVLSHAYARQYVAAFGSVTTDLQRTDERVDPRRMFLHAVAGPVVRCAPQDRVADLSRTFAESGAEAVAVVDADQQFLGIVTAKALLMWIADGRSAERPVSELVPERPPTVGPEATVADGVTAMGATDAAAVAMTTDGTPAGRLITIITPRNLAPAFGDQPPAILRDIRSAPDLQTLRTLNGRARACALQHLTGAASTDWIARFTELVDHNILTRILALSGLSNPSHCWCVSGAAGRGESIAKREPRLVLIHDDRADDVDARESYARVIEALAQCDYLPAAETPHETSFYAASVTEWSRRYGAWIENPVMEGMAASRSLFDLRAFHGARELWSRVGERIVQATDRDIVQILAHDCLASLPPLTFYQDAVVDNTGEHTTVFRLNYSAVRPLVDLGRVFGMAARQVIGTSTLGRFAIARRLLPAQEAIFRDASETLRIVLWQQGRVGISQGTIGAELPPALLGRSDRHLLKSGFPAIHRLIEFTADSAWLDAI